MQTTDLNTTDIIHTEQIVTYIEKLVKIPSPTGFTSQIQEFLIQNAREKNIPFTQTPKGAIIYKAERKHAAKSILFAAHLDTLGAMVKSVEKDKIKIHPIGGYPPIYIIGTDCKVHSYSGTEYSGTILPENPSVHLNKNLKDIVLNFDNIYLRLDLQLKDDKDSLKHYVQNGNFISFDPNFSHAQGFVKSRHLDDKAGSAILLYLADILYERCDPPLENLENNIYLYFNITEETSQGISGLPPVDEMVVVDMGCVGTGVEGNEFSVSICAMDGSGPYHYDLTSSLIHFAIENKLSYKTDVFPFYASDGSMALRAGNDVKVALIGPGVHASHGYERTHELGLLNTLKLLIAYLQK